MRGRNREMKYGSKIILKYRKYLTIQLNSIIRCREVYEPRRPVATVTHLFPRRRWSLFTPQPRGFPRGPSLLCLRSPLGSMQTRSRPISSSMIQTLSSQIRFMCFLLLCDAFVMIDWFSLSKTMSLH